MLVMLVRRLTTLGPLVGAATAGIVALAPAALFTTEFTWSESLVAVAVPRRPCSPCCGSAMRRRHGVASLAGLLAALAFGTHSRMLPLAAVTVGFVALLAIRRRMHDPFGLPSWLAATVVSMIAVRLYAGFVFDELWDEPSTTNSIGGVIDHIGAPGTILIALAGQAWYVLVSTVGLAVYGTFLLVGAARRSTPATEDGPAEPAVDVAEPADRPSRLDALVVLAVVVACIIPSVLFMAGRMRPDQIIYGRYNDGVLAPVLIAGLAFLLTDTSVRRLAVSARHLRDVDRRMCARAPGLAPTTHSNPMPVSSR